jgi:hypothetical protein
MPNHVVLCCAVAAVRWIIQDLEPARSIAHEAICVLICLMTAHDVSVLVDATYVLRHVIILAGISAGVIREAVLALKTILCKFRYGMV